jgi:hydrogenase/urease accessory protein HupE
MRSAIALLVVLACALVAPRAYAHGMRSVYVEIVEIAPGRARVTMHAQVPVTGARLVADAPCVLSAVDDGESASQILKCPDRIGGARIGVDGLGPIVSEAVMWMALADDTEQSHLATKDAPTWTLPSAHESVLAIVRSYVALGVRHILTGPDHLLFLVALVLSLRRVRAVLLAETAFTLSHSLSFSASALGWVKVSSSAAEACIALSLVLVALDIGRAPSASMRRDAWRGAGLAFAFGLVHGLGFAGGLAEIGLPSGAIPAALVGFAGGVEVGQIAFLALVLALLEAARRTRAYRFIPIAGAYAVGAVGFFWLIERVRALLPPHA